MKKTKKRDRKDTAEQVSTEEALGRMKQFVDRKELFLNAVKKGKDRGVSAE